MPFGKRFPSLLTPILAAFVALSAPALASDAGKPHRTEMMIACSKLLMSFTAQDDFHQIFVGRKLRGSEGLCGPSCMVYTSFAAEKVTGIAIPLNAVARMALYKKLYEANPRNRNESFGTGLFPSLFPDRAGEFFAALGLPAARFEVAGFGYSGPRGELSNFLNILSGKKLKRAITVVSIAAKSADGGLEGGHFVTVTGHNEQEREILIVDPNSPWKELRVRYEISEHDQVLIPRGTPLEYLRSGRGSLVLENAFLIEFPESDADERREGLALLRDYARSDYLRINPGIRENPESPESLRLIKLLTAALADLPRVTGQVYRGAGAEMQDWVDTLKEGQQFVWDAPTSATLEKEKAGAFGPIIFTIESLNARNIEEYAQYTGVGIREYEVLFKPKARFEVVKVSTPYPGFRNREVTLREVPE